MSNDTSLCALGLDRETLSAWRDQMLPEAEARRIAQHVPTCAACQRRLGQFTQIALAVQQQPAPDLRAQTWHGLQARLAHQAQHPLRLPRAAAFSGIGTVALVALIAILFAFVLHQRPNPNSSIPVTSVTASPTASATTAAATCASALPGAGTASAGTHFTDLPLPQGSMSVAPTQMGGGGAGQFTLYDLELCTPNSSPSAITAFFANLTAAQWQRSATFPADGAYQSACGTADCWDKGMLRYVRLSLPITDLGNGTERYHLTLAVPPAVPNCSASGDTFSAGYVSQLPNPGYTSTQVYANIPLPPLSRTVVNHAAGGQEGYTICSAGTVASITAFMNAHLASLGWTASGNGTWAQHGYLLTVAIPSPTNWQIGWHNPDVHP
jgi:hypothetical protein